MKVLVCLAPKPGAGEVRSTQNLARWALSLLFALALGLLYGHTRISAWDEHLRSTTVGGLRAQHRGDMWLQSAILADFDTFPAYSGRLERRLRPLDGVSLSEFSIADVNQAGLKVVPANPGDDLGLYYVGMLLHQVFDFDAVVVGLLWFAILLYVWCLFFFCFHAFRRGAFIGAIVIAIVYVVDPVVRRATDGLEIWHPYAYVALVPFALYSVKQAGESLFDSLGRGGGRRAVLAAVPQAILLLVHLGVVACLLTIRSSAIVLIVPFCGLLTLEWWWSRGSDGRQVQLRIPAFARLRSGAGSEFRVRAGTARALFIAGLIALSTCVGLAAPGAVISRDFAENMSQHHVFWHTIWVSLGEYPNELQFKWSDHEASLRANFLAGRNVVFQSREYEEILKQDVIRTVQANPDFLLGVFEQKMQHRLDPFLTALVVFGLSIVVLKPIGGDSSPYIPAAARLFWLQFHPIPYVGLALLANRLIVLLSANHHYYYYPSLVAETLAIWTEPVMLWAGVFVLAPVLARVVVSGVRRSRSLATSASSTRAPLPTG